MKCAVRLMVQGAGKDQEHLFRHPKLSDLSRFLGPGPGDRIPNYFESKASVRKVSTLEYDLLDSFEYVVMFKTYALEIYICLLNPELNTELFTS